MMISTITEKVGKVEETDRPVPKGRSCPILTARSRFIEELYLKKLKV